MCQGTKRCEQYAKSKLFSEVWSSVRHVIFHSLFVNAVKDSGVKPAPATDFCKTAYP